MKIFLKTLILGLFLAQSSQLGAIGFSFNPLKLFRAAKTAIGAGIGQCQSALAAGAANVAGRLLERPAVQKMVQNFAADQIKAAIPAGLEAVGTLAKTYAQPTLLAFIFRDQPYLGILLGVMGAAGKNMMMPLLAMIFINQFGIPGKVWAFVKAIVRMIVGLVRTIARVLSSGIGKPSACSKATLLCLAALIQSMLSSGLMGVCMSFVLYQVAFHNFGKYLTKNLYSSYDKERAVLPFIFGSFFTHTMISLISFISLTVPTKLPRFYP